MSTMSKSSLKESDLLGGNANRRLNGRRGHVILRTGESSVFGHPPLLQKHRLTGVTVHDFILFFPVNLTLKKYSLCL